MNIDGLKEMLKTNPKTEGWTLNQDGNRLEARTEMTWRSWGEKLSFEIEDDRITITSRPAWRTTIYDGGKNLENIYMLKEMIENV